MEDCYMYLTNGCGNCRHWVDEGYTTGCNAIHPENCKHIKKRMLQNTAYERTGVKANASRK